MDSNSVIELYKKAPTAIGHACQIVASNLKLYRLSRFNGYDWDFEYHEQQTKSFLQN